MGPVPGVATPPHLSSVTFTGQMAIFPYAAISLAGSLTNRARIFMTGMPGAQAKLYVNTDLNLSGGGAIALIGGPNGALIHGVSGQRLTNEDNLILGAGRIGDDRAGLLAMSNRGTIQADGQGTIQIDPVDAPDSFINEGLLHAENNGTILVDDGDLLNRGKVLVYAGGTLTVKGKYNQTAGETTIHGVMTVTGGNPTFAAGTKVGGFGKINGKPANVWGTLSPGDSVGTLEFEGLQLMDGASYEFQIDGPNADLVRITGAGNGFLIEPGATYYIDVTVLDQDGMASDYPLFAWDEGDPFDARGDFDSITWDLGRSLASGHVVYRPDERKIVLADVQAIPEPGSSVLLVAGGMAFALFPFRRRASAGQ